jgi:MFS family permease
VASGLTLLGLGSLGGAAAPSLGWLVVARVIESGGILLVGVGGPAYLVAAARPGAVASLMGFWPAAVPAGTALAMFTTPALAQVFGWRAVWLCGAAVALVAFVVLPRESPARRERGSAPPRGVLAPLRQLRSGLTLCLGLASVSYTLLWLGVLGLLPIWFDERMHLSVVPATALTGIAFLANAITTTAAGALQHRGVNGWALIAVAGCVFLPSVWLLYVAPLPIAVAALTACILSAAGGLLASANMRAVARHSTNATETADRVAVIVQFSNIGQLSGPPLVALAVASGVPALVAAMLSIPSLLVVAGGIWLRSLDGRLDELSLGPGRASRLRAR